MDKGNEKMMEGIRLVNVLENAAIAYSFDGAMKRIDALPGRLAELMTARVELLDFISKQIPIAGE